MAVYLIRAGSEGPVKIGHASNPAKRIAGFQTAHYERLTLLRMWPGGQPEEAALHRAFSEYRLAGEWFRFCPAMLEADPAALVGVAREGTGSLRPLISAGPDVHLSADDVERRAKTAGLTVAQLCARAGVAHSTFTRWRAGRTKPTLDAYSRLIAAINGQKSPPKAVRRDAAKVAIPASAA